MSVTRLDGVVLLYNYAVVLSGGYVVMRFGITDRVAVFGLALVLALIWTLYFRIGMISRVIELE